MKYYAFIALIIGFISLRAEARPFVKDVPEIYSFSSGDGGSMAHLDYHSNLCVRRAVDGVANEIAAIAHKQSQPAPDEIQLRSIATRTSGYRYLIETNYGNFGVQLNKDFDMVCGNISLIQSVKP